MAAEPPPDPDLSTEGMRTLGPLRFRPFLLVKDVGYDDNIRFVQQGAEGDYTATAAPGLKAVLLTGRRGGIHLSQEFDYVAYLHNTQLNHLDDATRIRGVFLARSFQSSLEDRYAYVQERPTAEIDQRIPRESNAVTAAMRTRWSSRVGLSGHLRHEWFDYKAEDAYSESVKRALDRDESTLAVSGEMRVLPKTTMTLDWIQQGVTFADSSLGKDNTSRSLLPGLRFDPSASLQGSVRAGYLDLRAPEQPKSDYRGAVGDGRLSVRMGASGRATAAFGRSLVFSTVGGNLYYVVTILSLSYEQYFSRRTSAEVTYGRGLNHYPIPFADAAGYPPYTRDDHLASYQLTWRYRTGSQVTLNAHAQRETIDSTHDSSDRTRNFYGFTTSIDF